MIDASWSRHMQNEANRGAHPMHRNRPAQPAQPAQSAQPAIALVSLVSLMAALALAFVQNVELDGLGMGRGIAVDDGIARMGIEGEGDLPLPVAEQS
jgi:hypothetical protein